MINELTYLFYPTLDEPLVAVSGTQKMSNGGVYDK